MAQVISDPMLRHTNLSNEPADYIAKREELRLAEIESMRQRERVAALRRKLPKGAIVRDYVFEEGPEPLRSSRRPIRRLCEHMPETAGGTGCGS